MGNCRFHHCRRGHGRTKDATTVRISILGGGGFLGQRIAGRLARTGRLLGIHPVTSLTLFDMVAPRIPPAAFPVTAVAGDVADLPPAAIPPGTDIVFHLAAVVSAQAEADYDLGRRVNLRGTDAVIDACRAWCSPPRSPASVAASTPCWATSRARPRPTATARRRRRPS
jgi:nucleoside-diphosphate-sugar epimerase